MASPDETRRCDGPARTRTPPVPYRAKIGESCAGLIQRIGVGAADAVVVLGGGNAALDPALRPRLAQLLDRGLLRALGEFKALCVLRGRADALSSLLVETARESRHPPVLLGVAPADLPAAPETGPTDWVSGLDHMVFVPGARWGDDARCKIELAQQIANGRPVFFLLIGGDATALAEARLAVRQGWPVLVVTGTGGAADALQRQRAAGRADGDDPVVAEILADGQLQHVSLGNPGAGSPAGSVAASVETLSREVLRLSGGESVLAQSWRRFAAIDAAAKKQQADFHQAQMRILVLGVLTVLLAICHGWLQPRVERHVQLVQASEQAAAAAFAASAAVAAGAASGPVAAAELAVRAADRAAEAALAASAAQPQLATSLGWLEKLLSFVLIGVPILLSALIAAANRFNYGKRWVLLRSAAEGIKREVYRYRLHGESYAVSDEREKTLAKRVEDITRRLARTEVNTTSLPAYTGAIPPQDAANPRDNGLSRLSTDQYVRLRLRDQLEFYRRKTVGFENELRWLQRGVLASGAVGTLLAVPSFGLSIWIAFTAAITGALVSYLAYRQVESTLTTYNQTATDLENILAWWTSLEPLEQAEPANIEALSSHTEDVLSAELASWTQRMSDALEKLRDAQTRKDEDEAGRSAGNTKMRTTTTTVQGDLSLKRQTVEVVASGNTADASAQAPAGTSAGPATPAAPAAPADAAGPAADPAGDAPAEGDAPVRPDKPLGTQ